MNAQALRRRIVTMLLDKIEDTRFPSKPMLDRTEAALATPDDVEKYAEILLDKVEDTRFPSPELMGRLDRLVAALPAE